MSARCWATLSVLVVSSVIVPRAGATQAPAPTAALVCQGCHGADGSGNSAAAIPRIAGQSSEYLEKQLKDYASGAREHPIMQNFAKALSDDDRAAVATFFGAMHSPVIKINTKHDAAQLALGHRLAHQGSEQQHVQACQSCHGPDGVGVPHAAPYIAGQSAEYLTSALKSFKDGARKNDPGKLMSSVATGLTEADITAAAAYFSTVTP
jgi:thiosulfate dehydrogenase